MNECMVNKGTSSLIMNTFLNIKHVSQRLLFLGQRSLIKNKTQTAVINIVSSSIFYKLDVLYAIQHTCTFRSLLLNMQLARNIAVKYIIKKTSVEWTPPSSCTPKAGLFNAQPFSLTLYWQGGEFNEMDTWSPLVSITERVKCTLAQTRQLTETISYWTSWLVILPKQTKVQ